MANRILNRSIAKICTAGRNMYRSLRSKTPFQDSRDLWWFPLVICSVGALTCFNHISFNHVARLTMNKMTLVFTLVVLIGEVGLLLYYKSIQGFKVMDMKIGPGFRSVLNCVFFVSTVGITGLNVKSLASILFFDFNAAALVAGERLLEQKTDFGVFLFRCGCSITQANLYFGYNFNFWVFVGIVGLVQAGRGYLLKFFASPPPPPADESR